MCCYLKCCTYDDFQKRTHCIRTSNRNDIESRREDKRRRIGMANVTPTHMAYNILWLSDRTAALMGMGANFQCDCVARLFEWIIVVCLIFFVSIKPCFDRFIVACDQGNFDHTNASWTKHLNDKKCIHIFWFDSYTHRRNRNPKLIHRKVAIIPIEMKSVVVVADNRTREK